MAKKDLLSNIWRNLMRRLTGRLGTGSKGKNVLNPDEISSVLIIRPNHRLGNMLLITPVVKEVEKIFPVAKIDLFVKGNAANLIFKNYRSIHSVFGLPRKAFRHFLRYIVGFLKLLTRRYDLILNTIPFSSSGRLATRLSKGKFKFYGDEFEKELSDNPDFKNVAKSPVMTLRRHLKALGLPVNTSDDFPVMDMKLSEKEKENGTKILAEITGNRRGTICLFTFATDDKILPKEWWIPFYQAIKEKYPDYNIIEMLNYDKISQINGVAPSFYSQNIREMASVLSACKLFIGTDSGVMHLSSASGIPTLGIFTVTDPDVFGPYGNNNVGLRVSRDDFSNCLQVVDKLLSSENND